MRRALIVGVLICAVAGLVAAQSSLVLWGSRVRYLFRDRFTTDASAPLSSPRTCEPGPGQWTITDSESKISIVSGQLSFAGGKASPAYGDPMVQASSSVGSAGGTTVLGTVVSCTGIATIGYGVGRANPGFRFASGTLVYGDSGSSANAETITLPMEVAVILRPSSGGGWCCRRSPGGRWELQWVTNTTPNTNPVVASYDSALVVDDVRVAVLPAWATEANIYTSYTAKPANPQAGTMTADGLVYVTWTPAAGEVLELDVRRSDDDNRWVHRCDQAGSTMKIIERNGGVETERASGARTWTVGTAYRIGIVAVGESIRQIVGDTTRNTYTSAAFNRAATGVHLSGHTTAADLYAWPRYPNIPGGV